MEIIFTIRPLIPNTGSVSWKSSYPARGCASGKRAITGRRTMPRLRHPPVEMLQGRALKAVFALGAGVDSILSKLRDHPDMLPLSIPLFRLEDTGMGRQMQEYAVSRAALVPPL